MLHACYATYTRWTIHTFLRVFLVVSLRIILLSAVVGVLFILYFNKHCFSSSAFRPVPLCNAGKLSLRIMLLDYLTIIVCSKVEYITFENHKDRKIKD